MLPSAAIYELIGLNQIARGALLIGSCAITLAAAVWFFTLAVVIVFAYPIRELMKFFAYNAAEVFWDLLRTPTEISNYRLPNSRRVAQV
jgi:hypothetical protein